MATSTIKSILPDSPTLSTSGISVLNSRGQIMSGGVYKKGKWRYVDIVFKASVSLSANNYWGILTGFDTPLGGYASLTADVVLKNGGNVVAFIDGNLTLSTAYGAIASGDTIAINGWYLTA